MKRLVAIGVCAALMLVAHAAYALPPVTGGSVLKPYPAVVAGRALLCRMHVYNDGLIVRCVLLKGAA